MNFQCKGRDASPRRPGVPAGRPYLLALLLCVLCASARAQSIYYIDYLYGSDTNTGQATNAAWQTHPYMPNTAVSGYVHQPGDQFIFRGGAGETWPSNCFPWNLQAGGSSSAWDQYTVNSNWFAGGAFARPVFDGGYAATNVLSISYGVQFINLNSLDIRRSRTISAHAANGCVVIYDTGHVHGNNLWLHDWITAATNDDFHGGWICFFDASYGPMPVTDIVLANSEISNLENTNRWNGVCVHQGGVFNNCLFHDNSSCILGAIDVNGCTIWDIEWPYTGIDPVYHVNGCYMDFGYGSSSSSVDTYVRHSVLHDIGYGCNMAYPNIERGNGWVYDNLFYGVMPSPQAVYIETFDYGYSETCSNGYVFNNTIVAGTNTFLTGMSVDVPAGIQANRIWELNNLIIGNSASFPNSTATNQYSYINDLRQSNNVTLTVSQATADGYTLANLYQPTSTNNPTYGAGLNLATLSLPLSITTDLIGTPWAVPPDVGCYQFVGYSGGAGITIVGTNAGGLNIVQGSQLHIQP